MNWNAIRLVLGKFSSWLTVAFAVPALVAILYAEWNTWAAWAVPAAVAFGAGRLLTLRSDDATRKIFRREGLVIVTATWLWATVLGALPFVLSGALPNFVDGLFEAMSGFTTTGSTVFRELGEHPKSVMFWRSLTHWLGGMGIVVLFVAVLPALGVGGRLLYEFEVPGVDTSDLKPQVQESARLLWRLYVALTVTQIIALLVCGLDVYDAVVHTFGTVATGGFSPHADSVGAAVFSPAARIVITIFMFLAGVNFTLYLKARRSGLQAFTKDPEFRTYAAMALVFSTVIFFTLLAQPDRQSSAGETAIQATFTTVAIGTTTGYGLGPGEADFNEWPPVLRIALTLFMVSGGMAGSTAGGFKVFRLMLVVLVIRQELHRFVRPKRIHQIRVVGHVIPDAVARNTIAFFGLCVMILCGATLALIALGLGSEEAWSASMTALFNIGPGLGLLGPTAHFGDVPTLGKLLLTALMLFGRLEVFTALVLLTPSFYRD